jgi:hypothetical protein
MRLLAVLLIAAISAAPSAVRADDASALLAKHKAFIGWQPGDGTFTSLSFDGAVTYQDGTATKNSTTVHSVRKGLAFRTTSTSVEHGTVTDAGFTGRVFWQTNRNGFTHPVIGDAQKYAVASELIFNEGFSELPGTTGSSETLNGVTCTNVRVKVDASFPIDVCIDAATGELKRATIDPNGSYETRFDVLAYAEPKPGKRVISSWRDKDGKYTHTWTKVAADAPIADPDLHPPSQSATWKFANAQAFPIEYEFSDRDSGIYVNATVNGVKGRFLVDTGASNILLNRSFAARANVKNMYSAQVGGVGGLAKSDVAKADSIEVGGNVLSNVIVTTLSYDFANGKEDNGKEVDGLIGFDLFGGAIVSIDLDAKEMTIFDPKAMHLSDGQGIQLAVDLDSLQPVVAMTVNGKIPIRAMLDSGDLLHRGMVFSTQLASKYGLRMLADVTEYARGIGGVSRMHCGVLDSLSVGPVVYQTAPACEARGFQDNWALVGFDFIHHFNLIFDYPEGKIVLLPRAGNESD